jgi:FkbM family methyltransferase
MLLKKRVEEHLYVILLLLMNHMMDGLLIYLVYISTYLIQPLFNKVGLLNFLYIIRKILIDIYGLRLIYVPTKNSFRLLTDIDGLYLIPAELLKSNEEDLLNSNDKIVIDGGAHIGTFTLRAARVTSGVILAIEPYEENFKILKKNIALNNIANVIPINVAISSFDGYTRLYLRDGVSTRISLHGMEADKFVQVRCQTLKTLLYENNINYVDLLKLDIEGHELTVIKSSFPQLRDKIRKMQIEVHNYNDLKMISEILRNCGYHVYWKKQSIVGKNNYLLFAQRV